MSDWEDGSPYVRNPHDEGGSAEGSRQTIRQFVIRAVALLLLFSLLGSVFLALRGIRHITLVVGILAVAAILGMIARKQRESEDPYRSDDPPDFEIH